ncbi:ribonuclease HIII [candidate division KSB1 bacterium 4484_87]|nr:MAG: ribonuclease HIII [candidate division KSB1 bacterium 4484_87]
MPKSVFTAKFAPEQEEQLRSILEQDEFELKPVDHAFWQAQRERVFITFYRSGKVVIRGKNIEEAIEKYLAPLKSDSAIHGLEAIENLTKWTGTDESGKGDIFGPLVVAAVFVDKNSEHFLWQKGIQDSKKIDDRKIREFASFIRKHFKHSVITLMPAKYNELYSNFKNLNKLLAYGHALAIEHLLEKVECPVVLSDQFGDESLIREALSSKHKIHLVQKVRAEENLAVAAASILARDKFLGALEKMAIKYQMSFPVGASQQAQIVLEKFITRHGKKELKNVSKLHFKPIKNLLDD